MIILGIDPGIADMGYGVIEAKQKGAEKCLVYGSLKTPAGVESAKRLVMLAKGLEQLLDKWKPDLVGIMNI